MTISFAFRIHECIKRQGDVPIHIASWSTPDFFRIFNGFNNIFLNYTLWRSVWKFKSFQNLFSVAVLYKLLLKANKSNKIYKLFMSLVPYCFWGFTVSSSLAMAITSSSEHQGIFKCTLDSSYMSACKIAYYFRHLAGSLEEFIIISTILPLWLCVNNFLKQVDLDLENKRKFQWTSIKQRYLIIRQITDSVNEIIWPNVLLRTLQNFVFYAFNMDALWAFSEDVKKIRILVFFVNACRFSYLGADISYKVTMSLF